MRRFLICRVAALLFVLFAVLPAQAASWRDDSNVMSGFLNRIVEVVKRLLPHTTDEISFPKP